MRNVFIAKNKEVREQDRLVYCPVMSNCNGIKFEWIQCQADCAWFNVKSVSDGGLIGAFCGDKFIGNITNENQQEIKK